MKLYVGNLGEDGIVKSSDLRPLFERFGTVSECECIKNYAYVLCRKIFIYPLSPQLLIIPRHLLKYLSTLSV